MRDLGGMKSLLAALALALSAPALAVQAGGANPAPAQPQPDPAAVAAAREMLVAVGFNAQVAASARQSSRAAFTTVMREMETQYGQDFPDALEARLRAILDENTEAVIADLQATALEESARVYARHFTLEEIRELQRLQTLPVMVKYQRIAPQFMAELTQIGLEASARRMPALMQRIVGEAEAWRRAHPAPAAAEQ